MFPVLEELHKEGVFGDYNTQNYSDRGQVIEMAAHVDDELPR
jgi:hypothetical protein